MVICSTPWPFVYIYKDKSVPSCAISIFINHSPTSKVFSMAFFQPSKFHPILQTTLSHFPVHHHRTLWFIWLEHLPSWKRFSKPTQFDLDINWVNGLKGWISGFFHLSHIRKYIPMAFLWRACSVSTARFPLKIERYHLNSFDFFLFFTLHLVSGW